ncbi:hypothetical protein Pmani_011866 [Petrolisthes manimaculis]|uniref:Uncharacterized protein n=1 Tax=Petrolisthes manimaculis TaxID=1843537 RepID=A0AAE1Q0C2_9EUCA|nr:hypothetical protein Pmani_011866 [Petrolisthes manimaculis]
MYFQVVRVQNGISPNGNGESLTNFSLWGKEGRNTVLHILTSLELFTLFLLYSEEAEYGLKTSEGVRSTLATGTDLSGDGEVKLQAFFRTCIGEDTYCNVTKVAPTFPFGKV